MSMLQRMSFGALLRRHRRIVGFTQEELAERAEMSVRQLQYLEMGKHSPRPDTARRLSDALGLSTEDRAAFVALTLEEPDGGAVGSGPPAREQTTEPIPRARPETPKAAPAAPAREQRKRVSILFCDLENSTMLGESMDPEALRNVLGRYFDRMKRIIERHGGTVEKFIGDAVMAVFGVPFLHEDDALRACRAAMEMCAVLPELGLAGRIGLQTGEVVTGMTERLVTGDPVNVAARLEAAALPGEPLMGEETFRLVKGAVEAERLEPLSLKGKRDPVPAYRLVGIRDTVERRPSIGPMVGRKRELRRLQDAYAQAVDDRSCQLFTVLGAAGIGKSRLALEFLREVESAQIVRGRCLSYGEGITFGPVVEVIRQIYAAPSDPFAASAVRSLLRESDVSVSAQEIAWAFRKLLEEQAQQQPVVLVFDDIHWGEETFLDLIEHIADLARDAPILLLCMARPELLEKRPGWAGGKWNATTVLLEPLESEETDRLLGALGGVSNALRDRVRVAAEGNPLFVEEMVALIRESGGAEVTVPPTIQALLAARLDRLDPSERHILECGAVEGRVFHRGAVSTLLVDETNLAERLVSVVRKELVRPARAELLGEEAYRFRHLLIRDAAYDALPKAIRADLHQRLAAWLQARGAEIVDLDEIVGYHLEQAVRYTQELGLADTALAERAGDRLARAGSRALWRGDIRAAQGLLERGLDLLRPIRLEVSYELDLVDAQLSPQVGATMAEAVAKRAREAGDRHGEAMARAVVAHRHVFSATPGALDELDALGHAAIRLLEEVNDHDGLARVWEMLTVVGGTRGRYEEYAQAAEHAITHARVIGRGDLSGLHAALVFGPRPADEALQTLEPYLQQDPRPYTRLWCAVLLAMLARFEEAWAIGREESQRARDLTGEVGAESWLAQIASLAGDHEAAGHYLQIFCQALESRGAYAVLSTHAPMLGRSLCMLGRYDEAEALAQRGRELGAEDDVESQMLWRQVQALVLSHRGQAEEAERLARAAVEIAEHTDALTMQGDALSDLADVLERAGRRADAVHVLHESLERYSRKKNLAMVAQVKARLARLMEPSDIR